jgi:hypothetical protein
VSDGLRPNPRLVEGATLTGRVMSNGRAIADAELWAPLSDVAAKSDSSGRFQLKGLSAGRQLIQVRHIGYAAKRDTVTLKASSEVSRDIEMTTQPVELDTVHAIAGSVKYRSPQLQSFERRRAEGFGHFIPEAVLRTYDTSPLGSILDSRISGLSSVGYKGGLYLMTNRGGRPIQQDPRDPRSPWGCWVDVYIDDLPIYKYNSELPVPDMNRMQVMDYAGVEFYTGASTIPPKYAATVFGRCGLLLLWTRER